MRDSFGRGKTEISVDDVIVTLNHSNIPTVIIEGKDDVIVFRQLEEIHSNMGLSVLPVGGRKNLLAIYDRIHEIKSRIPIAFISDKDCWCISGIPDTYQRDNIIFTSGYSIENDIIVDGNLLRLMSNHERAKFEGELDTFIRWYCLALARHMADESELICSHPNQILDDGGHELTKLRENEIYPVGLLDVIKSSPLNLVRGKSLLPLMMRQLSYKGRSVKHNSKSLIQNIATQPGESISRILSQVSDVMKRNIQP